MSCTMWLYVRNWRSYLGVGRAQYRRKKTEKIDRVVAAFLHHNQCRKNRNVRPSVNDTQKTSDIIGLNFKTHPFEPVAQF